MTEYILRFFIGGIAVSLFATMGDIFRPRSFAGLFGAAPSVALGTLAVAISTQGSLYAAVEGRSMAIGAIALCCYSIAVNEVMKRHPMRALTVTLVSLPVWLGVAFALQCLLLGAQK
jgi:uncharacterized protein DUF3147